MFFLIFNFFPRLFQPIFLGLLIQYFSPEQDTISKEDAYLYATALVLCMLLHIIMLHPFIIETYKISLKLNIACSSMIYRKVSGFQIEICITKLNLTHCDQLTGDAIR